MRIGAAAKQLNITASTLRKYARDGDIDYTLTPNGHRVFTQEAINKFKGITPTPITVFYTRSSNGNKKLLNTQTELLTQTYGAPTKVYTDNGSGLSEKRPGLKRLLKDAKKGKFTRVCITQKDRLTRFGYSYLETLLENLNITIEIVGESTPKTLQEELLQDFMSLVASFSGKFYRLRGYEQQKQLLHAVEKTINEREILNKHQ